MWEVLLEMHAGERTQGAIALVFDLSKEPSFGLVFLLCGLGRRTSISPGILCMCYVVTSNIRRRVHFEGCVVEPLQIITAILPWSKWSFLLLRIVLQDAVSDVTRIDV